jgi:hypothetical protein
MKTTYKIKKSLQIPMAISLILSVPIVIDVTSTGFPRSHIITVGILFVIFYLLAINSLIRKVCLSDEMITIRGLLGTKNIPLSEISLVDGVIMGTKQYISISGSNKTLVIPNSFYGFRDIVDFFFSNIKEEKLADGIRQIHENAISRKSDTIAAWITAAILVAIILVRFFPSGS